MVNWGGLFFVSLYFLGFFHVFAYRHPDAGLEINDFLTKYGYPIENHLVKTEDGYILTLHRIPHGKTTKKIGKPILLMHGVLCSSIDWVSNGPGWGLGLILSDLGYDVWLGNQRGNTYSKRHVALDPVINKAKFWDFSFHEIGLYDLSAFVDYILDKSEHKQLTYIGHSQGTTEFFVLNSLRPQYQQKFKSMVALAPAVYVNDTTPFTRMLLENEAFIKITLRALGIEELLPHSDIYLNLTEEYCSDGSRLQPLCMDVFYIICGNNPGELNSTMLTVYTSNTPAGASKKQMFHFMQEGKSGYFRQYDYGRLGNLKRYNQATPPIYDIKNINVPVYIFYSYNDALATPWGVEKLASELPNSFKKVIPKYGHLDFLWGIHAPELVYKDIINILDEK